MKLTLNLEKLPEGSVNGELNLLSPVSINPQVSKFTSLSARAPPVRQSHTELLVHSARDGGKEKPIVIAKPGKKALKVQRVQIWLPKDSISAGLSGNSVRDKDNVLDVTSNGSVSPKVAERACSIVSIGCVQKAEPVALAPQGGSFPQRPLRRRVDSDTIPVELQIARRRTGTISAENVERLLNPPSSNHREHAQEDAVDNKESLFFVAEKTSSRLWDIPASSTKSFSSSRKNDEFARNFVVEPSFPSIRSISLPVDARKRAAEMDPHISIVKTCPPSSEVIAPTMSAPAPAPLQQTAPRPANSLSRTNADLFLETDLPVSRLQVTIPSVARVNVGPSFLSSDSAASMSPRLQNRMIGEPELQALTCTSTASTVTGFNITSGNTEMDATFRQHVRGDDYFMRLKSISSERTEPGHLQSPHRQKAASATKRAPATVEGNTSVSRTLQELIVPSAPASHRPSPQRQFIHQHSRHHQQQQQQHNQNQPQRSNAVAITQRGVPMRAQAQLSSFPATQPSPFQHSRLIGRHSTVESASTIPKRTSVSDSLSGTQTTATKGGLFEQQNDFFELLQGSNDISASFELNIPIPEDVTALNGKEVRTPVRWGRPGGAQEGSSDSPERPLDAASAAAIDAAKRSADRTLLPHVLTPASALETYMHLLTHAEQSEILHFPRVYFLGHSAALKVRSGGHPEVNGGYDYKDGLYITQPGDHLRFRYEILSTLGKGSFGQVYRCRDHKLGVDVAVKVIKNLPIFNDQAAKELFTLKKLLPSSPDVPDFADLNNSLKQQQQQAYSPKSVADTRHHHFMVQLVDSFEFRAHKCFVFPVFGKNLYEHMRDRDFAALPMSFVKSTARQLLSALVHLKSLNILHCDIKPENVLIRDEGAAAVVLIDFGSSCLSSEATFTYIQSRFYRSPEVLLGLPYEFNIDLWSVAAILPELRSSYPAFPGESGADQLACIAEVLGLPPASMYERCTRKERYFSADGVLQMLPSPRGTPRRASSRSFEMITSARPRDADFVDFIDKCLRWEPEGRMSLEDCLLHVWLCGAPAPTFPSVVSDEALFADHAATIQPTEPGADTPTRPEATDEVKEDASI